MLWLSCNMIGFTCNFRCKSEFAIVYKLRNTTVLFCLNIILAFKIEKFWVALCGPVILER